MTTNHENHLKKQAFLQKCKNSIIIVKTNIFERLQVEGVNGKRCQENINIDAHNHIKINGKTMLDLCSTNDIEIIGKRSKIEAEKEPTNSELYATMHLKIKAETYVENIMKQM